MQSYKQGKQTNTDRFVAEGKKNKKEQSQYCDEAQERKGNSIIQKTRVALRLASIAMRIQMTGSQIPSLARTVRNYCDQWKESGIRNMTRITRATGGNSINDFSSKSDRNATRKSNNPIADDNIRV
jgi:hypothetical protein